jgi:hypothetical protein
MQVLKGRQVMLPLNFCIVKTSCFAAIVYLLKIFLSNSVVDYPSANQLVAGHHPNNANLLEMQDPFSVRLSPRGIFCTRTLNLRCISVIGYDMDYTLVHYNVKVLQYPLA